ncbi:MULTISPECIES: hypothetical protein [Glutamicibacter]|uniref:hypothetical protein n=1 Tax=Glutamicibacter TaxID=1742989 RepID=UPI003FCFC61A
MSSLPGNPHFFEGPQFATPETTNEKFIAENGPTDTTAILSELTRNTEATLALAFEQRTANMLALVATSSQLTKLDVAGQQLVVAEAMRRLRLPATN